MLESREGKLVFRTPYHPDFVSAVKALGARWNKEEKIWTVEPGKKDDIERLIKEYFPEEESKKGDRKTTLRSRVEEIVSKPQKSIYSGDSIERLVAFAYFYGREQAVKEVSDSYRAMIRDMRKRAEKSRYQFLIKEAIGDKDYIPFAEYGAYKTKELGGLETKL